MRIVAISDLHGTLHPIYNIIDLEKPDLLLCAGDWGVASEIDESDFEAVTSQAHTLTVFGNHDHLELLPIIKNKDGSSILLDNGEARQCFGLSVAGINGIWAKSHKQPYYVTDDEVATAASNLKDENVDILITHGCPIGMADLTPIGTHGGQRCFTDAFRVVNPKLQICGHLHRKSSYQTKDGRVVLNIGFTKEGDYANLFTKAGAFEFEHRVID